MCSYRSAVFASRDALNFLVWGAPSRRWHTDQFREVEATPKSTSHLSAVSSFYRWRGLDVDPRSPYLCASACLTCSRPDFVSRYPSCDELICNSSNSSLSLPELHSISFAIYSGTMFRIIGWRRVSKSSEKSSRSHTVFGTIGGSAFTSLKSFILSANCRYIFHLLI